MVASIPTEKMVFPTEYEKAVVEPASPSVTTLDAVSPLIAFSKTSMSLGPRPSSTSATTPSDHYVLKRAVRIKTKLLPLSSGFEYTRHLFDLRISPTKWDEFSREIASATELTFGDMARVVATAAGISLTGLVAAGICAGNRVRETRQLERVKTVRQEDGLLAKVLRAWNETYFKDFGLEAWLEINEAALRSDAIKAGVEVPDFVRRSRSIVEKTPLVMLKKESRERRLEEKKYMIILRPIQAIAELDGTKELPVEGDTVAPRMAELSSAAWMPELPSDDVKELSADTFSRCSDGLSD